MSGVSRTVILALCAILFGLAVNAADSKSSALEALLKKRRASQSGSGDSSRTETKPDGPISPATESAPTPTSTPAPTTEVAAVETPEEKNDAKKEEPRVRGPKPITFEDFDLVVKRNIFDPNRRKYVPRSRTPSAPPPPPKNNIVLKGTMKTPDAEFASFDSTLSECRGRFERDQEMGGFKLTSITKTNATLTLSTNVFTLAVGESLSKTGDGPWDAAGRSSFSSGGSYGSRSPSSGSSSSSTASTSSSDSSSSGGRSAALQRLLEMRKKSRGN